MPPPGASGYICCRNRCPNKIACFSPSFVKSPPCSSRTDMCKILCKTDGARTAAITANVPISESVELPCNVLPSRPCHSQMSQTFWV
jgi:hypothetical protein